MSIVKKYIAIFVCVFFTANAWGQAARSPFTSFGIGEPYGSALINTQGMAGVGVSQPQFWNLNNQNPALLIYNSVYTVFQAGIIAEQRTLRADTMHQKNVGGNLNYLVTAFPIKPGRWTTSIGLMPFTSVKNKFQYQEPIGNNANITKVVDEGSGGLTQLYWSNGVRLNKNFAVGLKTAYIFSSIVNKSTNQVIDSNLPISYPVTFEEKLYVKDLAFSAGVSYSKDSLFTKQQYRLSIGAVYNFATSLNTQQRYTLYRATSIGTIIDGDTLASTRGNIYVPSGVTAGISLSRGAKWSLGTEFSYRDWSTFKSFDRTPHELGRAYSAGLGGELTPNSTDEKYFKRVTYRTGVSYDQYPFVVNQHTVKDVGVTFGLSLPAGRSSVDVAFKYGKRGNKADNIFMEDYIKIFFGVTFNDQWFIKRKFD
jgi:hypothetical protein